MSTNQANNGKRLRAAGLLAAGAITGGVMAATLSANADSGSGTGSATSATPSYSAPLAPGGGGGPAMGSNPGRGDETTPSDSIVATFTKKAEAADDGGTVYRVETDAGDGAYEAHMTKADGTAVTVKFDKNLDVIGVEQGMGKGDPMPSNGGTPPTSGGASA